MNNLENEAAFRLFMEREGPRREVSRNNYISWLNYIASHNLRVDRNIDNTDYIIDRLRQSEDNREEYRTEKAYSDFKSVIRKYRDFLESDR